jgi:hypothetical protein
MQIPHVVLHRVPRAPGVGEETLNREATTVTVPVETVVVSSNR